MPVEFKDYYQTLGVPKTASAEQIKRAFRKLAMQYHPDKARGDKRRAEEKFKEINEAYEVLGDPAKRQKYDALGAQWNQPGGYQRPPPGWQYSRVRRGPPSQPGGPEGFEFHFGGTGFSEFFEQFFGGGRTRRPPFGFADLQDIDSGQESAAQAAAAKGADIEGDILVSLEEALRGAQRELSVRKVDPHTGRTETQTYRVRIPAGVHEGQLIRLAGRGHAGLGGAGAGDLYLRVKFAKHPEYRVEGPDLYWEMPVAPWEAVLGSTVNVPTLEGTVALKVPAGTAAGQQFRLRGQGLPRPDHGRGDLYAVVRIEVPSELDSAERALWERLRAGSHFDPRRPQ